MASLEEHRISIADNPSGSDDGVSTRIDEEDRNLPSKSNVDEEWIKEVDNKIRDAFPDSAPWPLQLDDETKLQICKLTLPEISQPRLETVWGFSLPRVVTIGPFHWHKSTIISNGEKWLIVYLMNSLYNPESRNCLVKIKSQAANARKRYSDLDILQSNGPKDDKEFAEMLLLDSYFILFMLTVKIRKRPSGYTLMPIASNSATVHLKLFRDDTTKVLDIISNKDEIAPDLLILDNQIPFFVIKKLCKELMLDKPLHEYALEFFKTIHPMPKQGHTSENIPPKFFHLLDLFHWSRVPENKYIKLSSSPQQLDSIEWTRRIPNAMELRESATTFERKTSGSSLDITFGRRWFNGIIGVLNIPELHIHNYSSVIFYNLIAFEMQSLSRCCCTMAFSILMQNLLQSEEDVKLLRRSGILVILSMTDSQLVNLFKCLRRLTENHQMPSDLSTICHQVQSYHNHLVCRFFRFVVLWYFPNPMMTFSVFVATMIFVPTLLQTIYSMISYYHS